MVEYFKFMLGSMDRAISYSEASWTGMFNYSTGTWEEEALNFLPSESRKALPPVVDSLQFNWAMEEPDYLNHWPELQSCRLFLGFGDGACANIGSRCTIPQRIAVTIGTSAAVRVCIPFPIVPSTTSDENIPFTESPQGVDDATGDIVAFPPPGLFCYRIHSNLILLGGALSDGESIIEWIRDLFGLTSDADFASCIEQVEELYRQKSVAQSKDHVHAQGFILDGNSSSPPLLLLPFFSGERSTGFRIGATGSIIGLTRQSTQQELVLSCIEGITLRLWAILKLMDKVLVKYLPNGDTRDTMILVSGNALDRNELWRQMLSDCTQRLVVMDPDCTEGSSRGVAVLIAHALKRGYTSESNDPSIAESLDLNKCWSSECDASTKAYWSRLSTLHENAIEHIAPLWD